MKKLTELCIVIILACVLLAICNFTTDEKPVVDESEGFIELLESSIRSSLERLDELGLGDEYASARGL